MQTFECEAKIFNFCEEKSEHQGVAKNGDMYVHCALSRIVAFTDDAGLSPDLFII
jgi:hypothetical protein